VRKLKSTSLTAARLAPSFETQMNTVWPFDDPPNTASLTTSFVLDGSPILRVYHDYDGGWQFHGSPDHPATTDVARVVSLHTMIARDATLAELHDLPYGWRAFRTAVETPWTREKNNPFPTHAENGYYIEDAVWMSQYRDDVNPPPEELRDDLQAGTYVKLLFRFAAEDAEREDNQTERMWVLITEVDEDENYIGTLENDPSHGHVLACGDTIHFHPRHVMDILEDNGA
jgi:hypothetical protein